MIWRFKSNKVRVGGGIRVVDHRPDGSIWLAVTSGWSETELVAEPAPPPQPPKNSPPVAVGGALSFIVEPKK